MWERGVPSVVLPSDVHPTGSCSLHGVITAIILGEINHGFLSLTLSLGSVWGSYLIHTTASFVFRFGFFAHESIRFGELEQMRFCVGHILRRSIYGFGADCMATGFRRLQKFWGLLGCERRVFPSAPVLASWSVLVAKFRPANLVRWSSAIVLLQMCCSCHCLPWPPMWAFRMGGLSIAILTFCERYAQ